MKFIYFYSPVYEYFSKHITENLSPHFDLKPILIDDMKNKKRGHTFWGGKSIKIELLIREIKENMGNYIVFSDATIFINSNKAHILKTFLNKYQNYDLCFPDNIVNEQYNIGFILIKCNTKTLTFFEAVLSDLKKFNGWDQNIVNEHICKHRDELKICKFNKSRILCGHDFDLALKDCFLIYKSFIYHDEDQNTNLNNRLKKFKDNNLIDLKTYNDNIKHI